jgi:DNA-binding CsgD family transcriptional regulator
MTPEERTKLIERYAIGPALLREALSKAPEEMRKWRPEPNEFSVHEIIVHCADSETNSHGRIRYIMTEDNATIIGYDAPVWAQAFDYLNHPLDGEMEVLRLVASGRSSREIAEALVLSVRTVERHITNVYSKTGARTRAQATAYALAREVMPNAHYVVPANEKDT